MKTSFTPSYLSLFFLLSIALRKLEAKRRNVEGKLERRGIVRHDTDSSPYNRWSHRGTFTNNNTCSNELKSHHLDTYDGLNLNALSKYNFHYSTSETLDC